MFRNSKIFEYKNRSTPCYLSVLLIISMILVFSFESIGILRKDANITKRISEIENFPIELIESKDIVNKDLRNNELSNSSVDSATLKMKRMRDLVFSSYDPSEHDQYISNNDKYNFQNLEKNQEINVLKSDIEFSDFNNSKSNLDEDIFSSLFDN